MNTVQPVLSYSPKVYDNTRTPYYKQESIDGYLSGNKRVLRPDFTLGEEGFGKLMVSILGDIALAVTNTDKKQLTQDTKKVKKSFETYA